MAFLREKLRHILLTEAQFSGVKVGMLISSETVKDYDVTTFQLIDNVTLVPIGTIKSYSIRTSLPSGMIPSNTIRTLDTEQPTFAYEMMTSLIEKNGVWSIPVFYNFLKLLIFGKM